MIELFLKYLKFEKRFSDHTIKSYKIDLFQFEKFLLKQYKIHKIESSDHKTIRSWIINLSSNDFTSTTINRKIASLKSFFKYLISREKINKNPSKKIPSLKKERRLPKFIFGSHQYFTRTTQLKSNRWNIKGTYIEDPFETIRWNEGVDRVYVPSGIQWYGTFEQSQRFIKTATPWSKNYFSW